MIIHDTDATSSLSGTAADDVPMSDTPVFDFSSYVIEAVDASSSPGKQTALGEIPTNKKHELLKQTTNVSNGTSVFGNTNEIFGNLNFKENEESQYDEILPKLTQTSSPSEKITIKVTKTFTSHSLLSLKIPPQKQPSPE